MQQDFQAQSQFFDVCIFLLLFACFLVLKRLNIYHKKECLQYFTKKF